jgi:hypothetical protein
VPNIIKGNSFRRLLILVSLLRALTLALNIAIVYKEKPSPLLLLSGLENAIVIIIGGNLITGLLNYLTAINKALKKEQINLTIGLTTLVLNSLNIIRSIAKKINDFIIIYSFRTKEYLKNNTTFINLIATIYIN